MRNPTGRLISLFFLGLPLVSASPAHAQVSAFFSGFDSGVPTGFSGITQTASVQGYSGLGTTGNPFGGNLLYNNSAGNPAAATVLTLTGLPTHTGINIDFLLAVIDSWDGIDTPNSAIDSDFFNVTVDGTSVFSSAFANSSNNSGFRVQQYVPPTGVELARRVDLGFNTTTINHRDSAYDMGKDPSFRNIAHSSSTLTVAWFASGIGWQGGTDESWGIDNVGITLNGTLTTAAPEPAVFYLLLFGLPLLLTRKRN